MSKKLRGVGIDFGTSHSAIAYMLPMAGGRYEPRAIELDGTQYKIPSAIFFPPNDDEPIVGEQALCWGVNMPSCLFTEFKPELIKPYAAVSLTDGSTLPLTKLAKMILEKLIEHAQRQNVDVYESTICHPVGLDWDRIITNIARQAGMNPSRLPEPQAALNYAYYHSTREHAHILFSRKNKVTLLIDFGAGTCDFLLAKVRMELLPRGMLGPKAIHIGEDQLPFAGRNIDRLIYSNLVTRWKSEKVSIESLLTNPENDFDLLRQIKKAKEEILGFAIPHQVPGRKFRIGDKVFAADIQADDLKKWTLSETQKKFSEVLTNENKRLFGNDTSMEDVELIVLAGGSSQIPWLIDDVLAKSFPKLAKENRIYLLPRPEMAVAFGAAIYNHDMLIGKVGIERFAGEDLVIVVSGGEECILVKRNEKLPVEFNEYRALHGFRLLQTTRTIEIRLVARGRKDSERRELYSELQIAEFDENIPAGTNMALRVAVNLKGEVMVYLSPSRLSGIKARNTTEPLTFDLLEISPYRD